MNAKAPHHLATLIALLALTAITAFVAVSSHGIVLLLILAMAKILLVAFRFMDLRHAHVFWKTVVVLFTGGFLTVIGLIAAT